MAMMTEHMPLGVVSNEYLSRDTPTFVQASNHAQREGTFVAASTLPK